MDVLNICKLINTPILILDKLGNFVLKNKQFDNLFGDNIFPDKIKKFKNAFSIESCILSSDKITNYNPIDIALESPTALKTFCTFQKNNEDFLYIYISATKITDYIIFEFNNK